MAWMLEAAFAWELGGRRNARPEDEGAVRAVLTAMDEATAAARGKVLAKDQRSLHLSRLKYSGMDVRKREQGRRMARIDKLVAWWKEELQRTKQLLELAKSGTEFGSWSPEAGMIDTTPADIARYDAEDCWIRCTVARHPEDK